MTLPSALTLTIATDVVGEIDALKPRPMPRPRFTVPAPLSKGFAQSIRSAVRSRQPEMPASFITVPVA
jgi:hypothetical protein